MHSHLYLPGYSNYYLTKKKITMSKTKAKPILFHLSNEEMESFFVHLSNEEMESFFSKNRRKKKRLINSIKAEKKILADNYSRG